MHFTDSYDLALAELVSDKFSAFSYLRIAEELLSNPRRSHEGRDLVIRALDRREALFDKNLPLLRTLVRKAGLYPYLKTQFAEHTISEEFAMRVHQTPIASNFIFHSVQLRVFRMLTEGRNIVLSAPTSMGKSAIVDSLIASGKFSKIVIVLPTVALVDETRRRLASSFSAKFQIIHHGSQVLTSARVIFVLTQERVNDRTDLNNVDIFVIDEFYKLGFEKLRSGEKRQDDSRVAALNSAFSKLLTSSKQFFLTGPFINGIRGLNSIDIPYTFIPTDYNTVALDIVYLNIGANDETLKSLSLLEILRKAEGPTIIYCKSAQRAGALARLLIDGGLQDINDDAYLEWLGQHYHSDWDYAQAYKCGIGLHYGGLPRSIQQHTIDSFNNRKLRYLICTSTIIEGVNTIAKNMVIYDNRNGTYGIDRFTHGNIRGRAGRMGEHFVGKVFCLEALPVGEDIFEVEMPIGQQDDTTPISFLAGLQPEHLTDYSQARFDQVAEQCPFGEAVLRKNSSFRFEDIEASFGYLQALPAEDFSTCLFGRLPKPGFAQVFTNFLFQACWNTLRTMQLGNARELVYGKINAYLFADSYDSYLRGQLARIEETASDLQSRSKLINDELRILNRLFAYTVPKALTLMEDLVSLIAAKRYHQGLISYSHMRSQFENYHLSPAWAGIEEMGVPVQVLHKLEQQFVLGIDATVDTAVNVICDNLVLLQQFSFIERHFIERAVEPNLKGLDKIFLS